MGIYYNCIVLGVFLVILVIADTEGRNILKIRKCCPSNEVIDIRRMKCADSGQNIWSPRFYKDVEESSVSTSVGYELVTRIPRCPNGIGVHILPLRKIPHLNIPEAEFRLLKDGRLVGKHSRGVWVDVPETSCIDGIMNYGQHNNNNPYTGDEADQAIISCPVVEETTSV